MNHTLSTMCPACQEPRINAIRLETPRKCLIVECPCGVFFAVHLSVTVKTQLVRVPGPEVSSQKPVVSAA